MEPMTSYKELLQQRDQLEQKIQEVRKTELTDAVQKVRALAEEYGLTADDIFPKTRSAKTAKATTKVPPKYRDPSTGKTWSGRGLAPQWMQGEDAREKLAIKENQQ